VRESRNLADTVRRAASLDADRTALVWRDQTVTWAELDGRVDALARGLLALGLPDSDGHPARVAIVLPNVPEFAVAYFGVLRAGLVAVPVNPGYTARELTQVLTDSGAEVLIGTPEAIATIGEAAPARTYSQAGLAELAQPGDPVAAPTAAEDIAVLLYTSGTEGTPKGAMLSHRAMLANHAQLARIEPTPVGPGDVVLLVLPLFHAFGLNTSLGAVAYHAATGVLVERFDPGELLRLIKAHRVSVVVGVPQMFVAWARLPDLAGAFEGVRLAVCGAAPLDATAGARFRELAGDILYEGYGLTETAPVLTSTLASPDRPRGSIGQAIPGVSLRLVTATGEEIDMSDDDFDLAPDSPGTDPGEIVVAGENLFSGYWPGGRDRPSPDGWWATGDVAYADANGDLFLVDRLRELILVSGFNVYPYEVEQVLQAHPAVAEAAVLGEPHPATGQTVKAFVVARGPVTVEELLAHCERNLARFKWPTTIEFRDGLPHSATGKVRKAALR
jgi:long-chain acyl-CoA synthetase